MNGRYCIRKSHIISNETSHLVQNWFSDNVNIYWPKELWPPDSSDLNPFDFYVGSVVEKDTNKSRYAKVNSLIVAIKAIFAEMNRDTLRMVCERFIPRIEVVFAANGGCAE